MIGILLAEIAEPGRQAVGAVLLRGSGCHSAACSPSASAVTLAAEYHLGMAEA